MKQHEGYTAAGDAFTTYFTGAQHTVLKLGVLQDYRDEDPGASWDAWSNGDQELSRRLMRTQPRYQDWVRLCQQSPAAITRVQVIEYPIAPYTSWMMALFQEYEAQGAERLLFLRATARSLGALALPKSDILVFDDNRALLWQIEPGTYGRVGGCMTLDKERGDNLTPYIKLRDAILKAAQPVVASNFLKPEDTNSA